MSRAFIKCVVQLPSATGLPEDTYENTFAFYSDVLPANNLAGQAAANLADFYNGGVSEHICDIIDSQVPRTANAITIISTDITGHLDGSPAGPPIGSGNHFTLGADTGGDPLPTECAIVASFHGAGVFSEGPPEGPRPAERHRGRVYLGPLNMDMMVEDPPVVNATYRTAIVEAMERLSGNTGNAHWAVWSRANADMYEVTGGFVDDAFDTQRRRGNAATTRTSFQL